MGVISIRKTAKFLLPVWQIRHCEHECPEKGEANGGVEKEKYQYGAWLRPEPMKYTGYSFDSSNRRSEEALQTMVGSWKAASTAERHVPHVPQTLSLGTMTSCQKGELTTSSIPVLPQEKDIGKENCKKHDIGLTSQMVETQHATATAACLPGEAQTRTEGEGQNDKSQLLLCPNGPTNELSPEGPVAMLYECEVGWVPEAPGSNPAFWKRIKREKINDGLPIKLEPIGTKRPGPSLLQALYLNVPHMKKLKENI